MRCFFDFRVNFVKQTKEVIGNMFVEVGDEIMPVTDVLKNANTMHQTHMSRFFDNQDNWSKSFKGRNKVDPYNVRPTSITVRQFSLNLGLILIRFALTTLTHK